jgi:hypothetical protein
MPKPKRSLNILLRVSPAEKATLEERAGVAGLTTSEYIRREAGIGRYGKLDLRRAGKEPREVPSEVPEVQATRPEQESDFEARVRVLSRRMPRVNAERLARAEQAREALRGR